MDLNGSTQTDGTGNNADLDDDNDGVMDIADAFPLDLDVWTDTDGDGMATRPLHWKHQLSIH